MEKITQLPALPERKPDGHKGDFGKVLIIGGSVGLSGAAALAGRSALRSGAGLVRVAVPGTILPTVAAIEPCYTTIPLPDKDGKMSEDAAGVLLEQIRENDVTAFGPGVGVNPAVRGIADLLTGQEGLRLVIDADGLNCLAKNGDWPKSRKASIVLTPHPGEMKRLWAGLSREPLAAERSEQAEQLANKTGCVVVLKGAQTVVADGLRVYVNNTGNSGMATAGSGDVLTGMIAAFIGQGLIEFDAAVLAVYLHGAAGDIAAGKTGQMSLIATDIIESLGEAFMKFSK